MHTSVYTETDISKELFPRVSPSGLYWENKRASLRGLFKAILETVHPQTLTILPFIKLIKANNTEAAALPEINKQCYTNIIIK